MPKGKNYIRAAANYDSSPAHVDFACFRIS